MHDPCLSRIIGVALEATRADPSAPAMAVLDKALRGIGPLELGPEMTHPASWLGQLVAEAFDAQTMTPAEWRDWAGEGAEATLRDALLVAWNAEVMPKFRARYGLAA